MAWLRRHDEYDEAPSHANDVTQIRELIGGLAATLNAKDIVSWRRRRRSFTGLRRKSVRTSRVTSRHVPPGSGRIAGNHGA
jgi:hypothetical protein